MRVAVVVGLAAQQHGAGGDRAGLSLSTGGGLEIVDDVGVGVEDVHALVVGDGPGEAAVRTDGHDRFDAGGIGDDLVLLTEGAGGVDEPGAVLGGDEVGREDTVRALMTRVVGEGRRERSTEQVCARESLDDTVVEHRGVDVGSEEVLGVGGKARCADDVALAHAGRHRRLDDDVVDGGPDHDAEVGR